MAITEELALLDDASPFLVFKGSPLIVSFELLEISMKDKKKKYLDKVESLMSVLESVVIDRFSGLTTQQTVLLFHFLRKHTLGLILHGDWLKNSAVQLHMRTIFKRYELISNFNSFLSVAVSIKYLLELLKDPWGSSIRKILCNEHCSEEELLNFTKSEIDSILSTRLEIMIAAGCDSQAVLLVEMCLQCIRMPGNYNYFLDFSNEITKIKDIYFVLLVKGKDNSKLSNEVSKLSLIEGLKLVRRCTKGAYLNCLKKSLLKMVEVVANMVIVSAMIHPVTDELNLQNLIEEWYNLYADARISIFLYLLKKMSLHALTSHHIYLLVQIIVRKLGTLYKSQCIEMYIRALTVNLNELEKYKSNNDQENTRQMEIQLSKGFLSLADYMKDDIITSRECLLTSFSLDPTSICFEKIRESAIVSGKFKSSIQDNNDSESEYNKPGLCLNCRKYRLACQDKNKPCPDQNSEYGQVNEIVKPGLYSSQINGNTDVKIKDTNLPNYDRICETLIRPTSKSVVPDALPTLTIHNSSANEIDIPQTLCDDLVTVICSARYQILNWNLDWEELRSRCELYKKSGKKSRSSVKDLKFLQIDYSKFNNSSNSPNTEANNISRPTGIETCYVNNTNNCNNNEIIESAV